MQEEDLIKIAVASRLRAHAPYSDFTVGAALLAASGTVYGGCNVENVSFGLTMCAERVAVGTAIADGAKQFELLALVSDSTEPVVPCGACRQVLAEFSPSLRVISSTLGGKKAQFRLEELLPRPRQGILE